MRRQFICTSLATIAFAAAVITAQMPAAPVYAIRGAKIVTAAGAPIDRGNVVMRNGIITDVGASAAIPEDAVVVDGNGMTVYPGLIDMANDSALEPAPAGPGGQGGRGGNAGSTPDSWAEGDRAKREALLKPDVDAAREARSDGQDLERLAAAGITSLLAVPADGLIKGQSALVNTLGPADQNDVSGVAGYRPGHVVIASPVAQHVTFSARLGGPGYPVSLLGSIAFVRQAFSDARWQKDARAWAAAHPSAPRPTFEPALDALAPALSGAMPVMFEAGELREILRALAMAKEFSLSPIILGGVGAAAAVNDLKQAKAAVILTLNTGGPGAPGGRGGGRGGAADTPIRTLHLQQNAPKTAAALEAAGIPYAFSSAGLQNPTDFVRGVARAIRDGGLTSDQAIRALTINAARIAGAAARVGSIENGKMANVIVTDGDLFADGTRVRRVFIAGRPADVVR
jgi:imidazolonepropionase-like amidohydrolase